MIWIQRDALHRTSPSALLERYRVVRERTEMLVSRMEPEDAVVQSMPDASPAKWHLAHTTWFFETFIAAPHLEDYALFNEQYGFLFNSYYEALGERQPRPLRGLLTRPSLAEVTAYRRHVDRALTPLLADADAMALGPLVELGLAHEEQHQELILMDALHLFAQSPLRPAYDRTWPIASGDRAGRLVRFDGGLVEVGADSSGAFAFDNEAPRHRVWLEPFNLCDRLVTNGEWIAFIEDGAYQRAELWHSDGWARVQSEGWIAPGYWQRSSSGWQQMTLGGMRALDANAPVVHVSYFEATAYARWRGMRLPTESEWEIAAASGRIAQIDDCAWQWTASAYEPYPGFQAAPGAIGEYNGKFMVNQIVLRGAASVTPPGHARLTYRNFFQPHQRWMFSGVRLARDIDRAEALIGLRGTFASDVISGLSAKNKSLAPKYFYDAAGSELFEQICATPEYYPTRTETALLARIADRLTRGLSPNTALVEFGSGASEKTRIVLDATGSIASYVPIDISGSALQLAASRLEESYPALEVRPIVGDFTRPMSLPGDLRARPKLGFFPGSTIGNFDAPEAVELLKGMRELLGDEAQLIIGVDLVKDEPTLLAAYNDAQGVTERFNKNLLARINRELHGNFDLDAFLHQALWNATQSRIEMYLVSRTDQVVNASGRTFAFKKGERLHTENSHKFTLASFTELAARAGWAVMDRWVSDAPEFALFRLKG
jgi:dimethylhistidine N-methyltransferase